MSVSGISSSSLFDFQIQNLQNKSQQFQQEFQQLGQDLQSGNLSAAQADFATLQPSTPQANSTPANSPMGQAFAQISRDLQSRNLSAAQQAYGTLQQDFQQLAQSGVLETSGSPQSGSSTFSVNG